MTDLRPIFLGAVLRPLRAAYAAGHAPLVTGYDRLVSEVRAAVAKRAAGEAQDYWTDEATGQSMPKLEYLVLCGESAECALQAHRKAFALMILHAWEKHVCTYMGWPEYPGERGFGDLKADGWTIDPKGLKRL